MNWGEKLSFFNYFGFAEEEFNAVKADIQKRDFKMLRKLALIFGYVMGGLAISSLIGIIPKACFGKYLFFFFWSIGLNVANFYFKRDIKNYVWESRGMVFLMLAFGIVESVSNLSVVTLIMLIFLIIASELYFDNALNYVIMCLSAQIIFSTYIFITKNKANTFYSYFNSICFMFALIGINYFTQKDKLSSCLGEKKLRESKEYGSNEHVKAFFVENDVEDIGISYFNANVVPDSFYEVSDKTERSEEEEKSEVKDDLDVEENDKHLTLFKAPDAKILVVDDTEMNLTVIKGLLKNTLISLDTCRNGYEALNMVQKVNYDCVLIDQTMPRLNGVETFRKIRELTKGINKDVPCIILTANISTGERERYIEEGFSDSLNRPIDSEKLENALVKFIPKNKVYNYGTPEYNNIENINSEKNEDGLLQKLIAIDGIDLNIALDNTGGASLLNVLLAQFREDIQKKSGLIEKSFNDKNWNEYISYVHALKNSAELIGALELSDRARKIEEAGYFKKMDRVERENGPMLELYRSYYHRLEGFGKEKNEEESEKLKPEIGIDELEEILAAIKSFVSVNDFESAESIMKELEKYRYPKEFDAKYKELRKAFIKADTNKIRVLLRLK